MRYLITGALGAIGAWTARSLLARGHDVVTFDLGGSDHRLRIALTGDQVDALTRVQGDVTDLAQLDAVLEELDRRIGLDRLRAVHVNDAQAPLGSNRDRHANIGEGLLGERLGVFLGHARLQGLPALLEVDGRGHGPDEHEMRKLKELHARWTNGA